MASAQASEKTTTRSKSDQVRDADEYDLHNDAWSNFASGLGILGRDRRESGIVVPPRFSRDRREFDDLYHADDIARTLAELPAQEMVREWVTIRVDDSTPAPSGERTETTPASDDLENRVSASKRMDKAAQEIEAQAKFFEALVWARVHGGSLMFIGADDGNGGDLSLPLDEANIKTIKFLEVFDRWDARLLATDNDRDSDTFGQPLFYSLQREMFSVGPLDSHLPRNDEPIHASRFIRFDGVLTSKFRKRQQQGWSDSIYVRLRNIIRDYNMSWDGVFHLISDFAQAIFKMKGLQAAMASDNDGLVNRRMALMDFHRSSVRAVPVDADGEDFERKATPVSGLPQLVDRASLRLAAAGRLPVSLLLGQSPAGLTATGESDISFFYDQISAAQETMLRPRVQRFYQLMWLAKDGPSDGVVPDLWSLVFNPLWQLSALEESKLRKTHAEADEIHIMNGVLTPAEVTNSRYSGDAYSTETTLDTAKRAAEGDETAARTDQEDGICDKNSPNYDAARCRER